ncbi:unnamed protein product [Arabis nemorensis]|uniref:Uncharacterized protein n=1 Tax=Arabis nemorensis TaxID=586526 RepID=A0A565B9P2_9BRAS|nr:unnamed protein product [Arabis nemorensis]
MIRHLNLIIEKYERRSRGLLKKLEDYPSVKKEAKKVPGLEKRLTTQTAAMDDLSKKVDEARQGAKYAEEELERIKTEKESLQSFHDQETVCLRSSRRHEVTQIIAKCDAKLLRIKKSISDNEEANRLSTLMNQAMAIKDYLASFKKVGADVSDDWFKELDENFSRFEKDFDAPDVEEVTDGRDRAASVNLPWTETVAPFDQYGTLMSAEQQEQDRLLIEGGLEADDAVTGEELTPLDGLPVIPTAQS